MKPIRKQIIIPEEANDVKATALSNGSPKVSDSQLWQEFQSGSETAYATIYNDNVGRLFSYGVKLVHDNDLVKDCIQDLYIELWDTKERLGDVKSIKSYLYKSIRRKLISRVSTRRKELNFCYHFEGLEKHVSSQEINLIEKQNFVEERQKLKMAMGKLNPKQQEIIHLKFYGQLSYEEISEVMSMDRKGVYNLMAYTIKLIRQHMVPIFLLFLFFPLS